MSLENRTILLIISGGIAAYKSLELIRRLKDKGAKVRCILTESGAEFITPLSVATLSGEPVNMNLFSEEEEQRLGHIRLSRETDLIVVAPATANMIAKMAHGIADNLASTALLASNKPILIAPAMNSVMWSNPATTANIATLMARGILQVGPTCGHLACGEEGAGRMSDPDEILQAVEKHFGNAPLAGKRALVTSGPTFEPIDPVRFIGNRSSGKQGHAIAEALAAQGATVTLVSGPTALAAPSGVKMIPIETATEMLAACQGCGSVDIAVCAAAVADWRPATTQRAKMKKGSDAPTLTLAENPDILCTLSQPSSMRAPLVIGFAAETDNVLTFAKDKFERKGCDWLLANQVGGGRGFATDENEVTLLRRDPTGAITTEPWPKASKTDIAKQLVEAIIHHFK